MDADVEGFAQEFTDGRLPGDRVRGVGGLPVKEHRMRDSSSSAGKRSGYRVYYYYDDAQIYILLIFQRKELPGSLGMRIRDILSRSDLLSP